MATKQQNLTDWLHIVESEYREMPGLNLTKPQAQRLWGLDGVTCDALLAALEATQFLERTPCGGYVLAAARR